MKAAMKAKDTVALESLRAIKSALLLAQTETGPGTELSEEDEVKPELAQAVIIEKFLPEQLTEEEIEKVVVQTIDAVGASGMKDMGKVMGIVSQELAGQADGKTISTIVKKNLM